MFWAGLNAALCWCALHGAERQLVNDKANAVIERERMAAEERWRRAADLEEKLAGKEADARKLVAIIAVRAARVGQERMDAVVRMPWFPLVVEYRCWLGGPLLRFNVYRLLVVLSLCCAKCAVADARGCPCADSPSVAARSGPGGDGAGGRDRARGGGKNEGERAAQRCMCIGRFPAVPAVFRGRWWCVTAAVVEV